MTDIQILEALQQARTMYERAVNCRIRTWSTFYDMLRENCMENGLCYYYGENLGVATTTTLLDELRTDIIGEVYVFNPCFWYEPARLYHLSADKPSVSYAQQTCLKPRLDHLNRTIARMESEIAAKA